MVYLTWKHNLLFLQDFYSRNVFLKICFTFKSITSTVAYYLLLL